MEAGRERGREGEESFALQIVEQQHKGFSHVVMRKSCLARFQGNSVIPKGHRVLSHLLPRRGMEHTGNQK